MTGFCYLADSRSHGIEIVPNTENIVLEHLRHIRQAVDDMRVDMREVKTRLGHLENQYASLSSRLDRLDERVGRIESRLDLAEA